METTGNRGGATVSKLTNNNLLTVEIPSYREITPLIETIWKVRQV